VLVRGKAAGGTDFFSIEIGFVGIGDTAQNEAQVLLAVDRGKVKRLSQPHHAGKAFLPLHHIGHESSRKLDLVPGGIII
jgi:hypothetical protein